MPAAQSASIQDRLIALDQLAILCVIIPDLFQRRQEFIIMGILRFQRIRRRETTLDECFLCKDDRMNISDAGVMIMEEMTDARVIFAYSALEAMESWAETRIDIPAILIDRTIHVTHIPDQHDLSAWLQYARTFAAEGIRIKPVKSLCASDVIYALIGQCRLFRAAADRMKPRDGT